MLYVSLATLHDGAAHACVPARAIRLGIAFRKMQMRVGWAQIPPQAIKTKFPIGAFEGKGMSDGNLCAVHEPFIHSPKMSRADVDSELVDNSRNKGELLRWANWTADADR